MVFSDYQHFIHLSRYARYDERLGRRETWKETVTRYFDFFSQHLLSLGYTIPKSLRSELFDTVYNLHVMPSMRCLMTAGVALERDNVCGYNCSYLPVDSIRSFDECLYILMCGTGVGYSVERQYINQLPTVSEHFEETRTTIKVADSKAGWARALKELIALLLNGQVPKYDTSRLRPAGAVLKTFGGRSSGPEPLEGLFEFTIRTFRNAKGRKLNSLESHDLMCKIGEVVVVGGVRRAAMISLSNFSDDRMRRAKMGEWWSQHGYRALANNSIAYTEKPEIGAFMHEWVSLHDSKSGERGLFNRQGVQKLVEKIGRRDSGYDFGTNPCSEIILRPFQFCNLSEAVVRPMDRPKEIKEKVRLATILGTWQSSLTNFKYLRRIWKENTEAERLLGVSLTGIMDNPYMRSATNCDCLDQLKELKNAAIKQNKTTSEAIGIPASTAITCVKPSGTVSQLVDSSSGIHPRYSPYYIRRVRQDNTDPLTGFLIDQGIPYELDVTNSSATVFSFPMASPPGSVMRTDGTAIENLETWKEYQDYWCEHKPSITVYVSRDEWLDVGAWVYKNFEDMSGVSFLPLADDDHIYQQAPYEEIDKKTYTKLTKAMPKIKWSGFKEDRDNTTASQELACTAGVCEI